MSLVSFSEQGNLKKEIIHVTYDNIKSEEKTRTSNFLLKTYFWKNLRRGGSEIDLSPPSQTPLRRFRAKGAFILKLLNNPLASCSLINFEFLLSHTAHYYKSIILPFFVLATFGFLLSVFFCTSSDMIKLLY